LKDKFDYYRNDKYLTRSQSQLAFLNKNESENFNMNQEKV